MNPRSDCWIDMPIWLFPGAPLGRNSTTDSVSSSRLLRRRIILLITWMMIFLLRLPGLIGRFAKCWTVRVVE